MEFYSILVGVLGAAVGIPLQELQAEGPATTPPQATEGERLPVGPLTWDNLPQSLRSSMEPLVGQRRPQAILVVETPAPADAAARRLDHGTVVAEQTVRPAAFATIATAARNSGKYGPAGALMWRAVSNTGDWWCWRNDERFPNWRWPTDLYCYQDADSDGDFDRAMENKGTNQGFVFHSRYQFRALGQDARLRDTVTYQPAANPADRDRFAEKVVVRYDGPTSGRVQPDGRLTDGEIVFDLLTGAGVATSAPPRRGNALVRVIPDPPDDGLTEIDRLVVRLDSEGRGHLTDVRGIVLEVERVDVDGSAQVRLISGLTAGEQLLFPTPTRESLLAMLQSVRDRRAD